MPLGERLAPVHLGVHKWWCCSLLGLKPVRKIQPQMLCRMQREEAELNSHSLSEREMETGGNFTCVCGLGGKKSFWALPNTWAQYQGKPFMGKSRQVHWILVRKHLTVDCHVDRNESVREQVLPNQLSLPQCVWCELCIPALGRVRSRSCHLPGLLLFYRNNPSWALG